MIFFHGTTKQSAEQIMKHGFRPGVKHNWNVHSKKGFVYLSTAYAPFYAMASEDNPEDTERALIKVDVFPTHLYPEDDFIMFVLGKQFYTQAELDAVSLEHHKRFWKESLKYMGNVSVLPKHIKILGCRVFDAKNLVMVCDPVISPTNFTIMGNYYKKLTEWIYDGKNPIGFKHDIMDDFKERE